MWNFKKFKNLCLTEKCHFADFDTKFSKQNTVVSDSESNLLRQYQKLQIKFGISREKLYFKMWHIFGDAKPFF